jgi:hypothetical protein
MLVLAGLLIRAMALAVALTARLTYWTFRGLVMLVAALAAAISASSASHRRRQVRP